MKLTFQVIPLDNVPPMLPGSKNKMAGITVDLKEASEVQRDVSIIGFRKKLKKVAKERGVNQGEKNVIDPLPKGSGLARTAPRPAGAGQD